MASHLDLGYKHLFAHPELVRELVMEFTPFHWLGGARPCDFERVNPGYISERFSERQDDIVWRVRQGAADLYLYILLEFQSRTDRWMALRMQVYIGLLYQDLVKRGELGRQHRLPAVLPLVLYTGAERWAASCDLSKSIERAPAALEPFQASQRYFLVDQQRLDPAALARQRSILSLLFRLELSELPDVIKEIAPALRAWLLEDAQAPVKRAVSAWAQQILDRQTRGEASLGMILTVEGADMGARKFETWADALEERGMQRGIEKGLERGIEQGIRQERERQAMNLRLILEAIIRSRFAALPSTAGARIASASPEELEDWTRRAPEAASIEELLSPRLQVQAGRSAPPRSLPPP